MINDQLFVDYSVTEFGEFAGVPAVGGAYEVAGDSLDGLEVSAAFGAFLHLHVSILISAFRTVIAVMVY